MTVASQERRASPRHLPRPHEDTDHDVVDVVAAFRRRWKAFAATTALVAAGVILASLAIRPSYLAESRIQLDLSARSPVETDPAVHDATPDPAQVDTEVALIRSRASVEDIVKRFGLVTDREYRPSLQAARRLTPEQLQSAVVGEVQRHLKVSREGASYVVDLEFSSIDPVKAARLANAFADGFLASTLDASVDSAARRSSWLDARLRTLGGEVQAADAAVARYKAQAGIASGVSTAGTITDQQVAPLSTQLATAESEAAAANSNLAAARRQVAQGGLQSVSGVLNSTVIGDLRRQRAEVLREAAEISTRYGPKHPQSIKVQQQLDVLDRQLRDEAQRILSGLDAEARAASARAQSLRSMLGGLKAQQADNARSTVQADALQREADARRTVYEQLAKTAQQMNQTERLNQPKGRLIERAVAPLRPAFPKRTLFAGFGILLGLLAGAALVLLLEVLANGLRTVRDVEALDVPLIASTPRLGGRGLTRGGRRIPPWDYLVEQPLSAYAESFRTVRAALSLGDARSRSVVVTSALPAEGKTSTAITLARIMAMGGEKVVLIDCDLRQNRARPASERVGLVEILTGGIDIDRVKRPDVVLGLDLIDGGKTSPTAWDVFGGDALPRLLTRLLSQYDRVILDAPPVLALADARTLAAAADAVILVARWDRTPKRAVAASLDRLDQDGSRVVGIVLSQVDPHAAAALDGNDPARYAGAVTGYFQG